MMGAINGRLQPGPLRLCQVSPISEMTGDKSDFHAYLLRLWRVNTGHAQVWHASIEDSRTGERKGFADLHGLLLFLEEQISSAGRESANDKGQQ